MRNKLKKNPNGEGEGEGEKGCLRSCEQIIQTLH